MGSGQRAAWEGFLRDLQYNVQAGGVLCTLYRCIWKSA
jgi:hypothetical protein